MNREKEIADIVEKISVFHATHGRSPFSREMPSEFYKGHQYLNIGWNDLLMLAGLPINKRVGMRVGITRDRTKKEKMMISNLREAYALCPGYIDNRLYDKLRAKYHRRKWYSAISIIKHFIGWKVALSFAGLLTRQPPKPKEYKEPYSNCKIKNTLKSRELTPLKGLERERDYTRRYLAGESMAIIGKSEGISRQFIHILIKRYSERLEETHEFLEKENSNN